MTRVRLSCTSGLTRPGLRFCRSSCCIGRESLPGWAWCRCLDLGATTWRHVSFVEKGGNKPEWLLLSDVCKHCVHAGCMEACPTGAIIGTEFDTVYIQQDICNGCAYSVPACPFGVPQIDHHDGGVHKCTLCYDRLKDGLEPACAKSCPTDSIQFGTLTELRAMADDRINTLHARGVDGARIYGDQQLGGTGGIGGLNALFIITDEPEMARSVLRERAEMNSVERLLLHAAVLLGQPLPVRTYRDQSP